MAPENTMLAFELALQRGADGIEFDVQTSRDGAAVVFHDATLERMTQGRDCRRVAEVSSKDLNSITLDRGAIVPLLKDVLLWADGNGLFLNIELKCIDSNVASLLDAVERDIGEHASHSLQRRIVISSFSKDAITLVKRREWPLKLALLLDTNEPVHSPDVASMGVHPHFSSIRNAGDLALAENTFVNVWTVNDSATARHLNQLGVDGIITDEIEVVLSALEE